jgi:hypothetical protein
LLHIENKQHLEKPFLYVLSAAFLAIGMAACDGSTETAEAPITKQQIN